KATFRRLIARRMNTTPVSRKAASLLAGALLLARLNLAVDVRGTAPEIGLILAVANLDPDGSKVSVHDAAGWPERGKFWPSHPLLPRHSDHRRSRRLTAAKRHCRSKCCVGP